MEGNAAWHPHESSRVLDRLLALQKKKTQQWDVCVISPFEIVVKSAVSDTSTPSSTHSHHYRSQYTANTLSEVR